MKAKACLSILTRRYGRVNGGDIGGSNHVDSPTP